MSENQMTNSYETFAEKTTDLQPKNSLVECNKYSAVKYLCEKNSDPTVHDKNGKTPYDLAVQNLHYDVSSFLEEFKSTDIRIA